MRPSGLQSTVVVLGAHGFVGRHVCRALSDMQTEVIGIGHGNWAEEEQRSWGISSWIYDDICLESLKRGLGDRIPQAFIHCGGSGSVSLSYSDPLEDYHRSVTTTAVLLDFVRTACAGRPRVVVASSAAVYGDQGDVDSSESSARAPVSPYGFHKVLAENICDSYSRFSGLQVSIVRLFSVYGPGLKKQLLWDAANKIQQGKPQFFGTGHELRDWIHVNDAASLLCAAAFKEQTNYEIYNGGHTKATTSQVLIQLCKYLGNSETPIFNGEIHTGNPRRLTANCNHAHRNLSWTPKFHLSSGLKEYADWFTAHDRAHE